LPGALRYWRAFHRSDEAVPLPRQSLDIARAVGRVAERLPDLLHRGIQASVKLHKGIGGPKLVPELVACYNLAWTLDEKAQELRRLCSELEPDAALPKFRALGRKLENPESYRRFHSWEFSTGVWRR
jgi:hypothetical protein